MSPHKLLKLLPAASLPELRVALLERLGRHLEALRCEPEHLCSLVLGCHVIVFCLSCDPRASLFSCSWLPCHCVLLIM